ncbi:hypothetical protein QBC44DRAFT_97924 [Cladorrhinum sp. PSN332]|nr:hypothetical protein QBC44DRAFT_97924 [Cladorrhinum sp. PSN332]
MSRSRKVPPGQSARSQAATIGQQYQYDEPDDSLDYSSGLDYSESFGDYSEDDTTEVTEATDDLETDLDQDTSVLKDTEEEFTTARYEYEDDLEPFPPGRQSESDRRRSVRALVAGAEDYDGYDDEPTGNQSGWSWFAFTFKGLGVLLVNGVIVALAVYALANLPKIAKHYWRPPLDASTFSLPEVATAHNHLAACLDPFNNDPDVDRTLRRQVFKLIKIERDVLEYPKNTKPFLASLLEHTILVAHQYHTFISDVANTINEAIKKDDEFLKEIELYEEVKRKADIEPSNPVVKFVNPLIPQFFPPENRLQVHISDALRLIRQNIDTSARSGKHLEDMIGQASEYYRKLRVLEQVGKAQLSAEKSPMNYQVLSWIGDFWSQAMKQKDRLFNIKELRGLKYALEELDDVIKKADGELVKARDALDELAVVTKIDAGALLEKHPVEELKGVFEKAKNRLEKARKSYERHHAESEKSNWEADDDETLTALDKWTTRAGVRDKLQLRKRAAR